MNLNIIFEHFKRKKRQYKFVGVIIILVLSTLLIDKIIFASNVIQQKYGVSIVTAAWFFGVSEIFFILGIIFMLKGSGVLNFRWKDIKEFKIRKTKVVGRWMYSGLMINRLAAIIPWVYILLAGWSKLPNYIVLAIFIELIIVLIIGILPISRNRQNTI